MGHKKLITGYFMRIGVSVLLLASLTACTMGRDYVKPETGVPESFKTQKGWKKAQPRDDSYGEKWWKAFNDPVLNGIEENVKVSNQDLAAAEARFRQAKAVLMATKSGLFPSVSAGVTADRSRKSENIKGSSGSVTSDFMIPAEISWEADIWGKVRRSVEAGEANYQASAGDLAAARLSIQAEVALNYFQLRTIDSQKKNLDETIRIYSKSLEMARNRYNAGVVSKADVLQAETQLKSTQAQAIDIDVQRAQIENALALLTGQPASGFSMPFSPLDSSPPSIPEGLPSELLERRPDIASAERRVAAANAQIGAAEAAYFPTIRLTAGGGYEASRISDLLDWPSHIWSIGVATGVTVFDGGLKNAQNEQAKAVYDECVAAYRQQVLTGFQEVEDNLAALRILEQEAKAQDEALRSAEKTLEVTLNQYKAGTVSFLNVIFIQASKLSNEKTSLSIAGRRMAASVLLIKALGGGWNADSIVIASEKNKKPGR